MVTRSFAPPKLLEEREPTRHPNKRKEIARMSTGGPAPKAQRRVGGKRAAECQLRPPSPEPDMSLLSWSDSGDTIHLDNTPPPEIGFFGGSDVIPDTGSLAKCKCAEVYCDKKQGASYGSDKKPKARYRVDPPGETGIGGKEPDFGDFIVGPRAYRPRNRNCPIDPPIDPPEDGRKQGKVLDQARGADPPAQDKRCMLE
jgi:hypothetical protein